MNSWRRKETQKRRSKRVRNVFIEERDEEEEREKGGFEKTVKEMENARVFDMCGEMMKYVLGTSEEKKNNN